MRVSWRSRRRDARAKIRAGLSSAEQTTIASAGSTRRVGRIAAATLAFGFGVAAMSALAAETGNPLDQSTAASLKSLGTEYGLLGTLLALALGAIGTLFVLLLKANAGREVALQVQQAAHEKAMAEKDTAHAKDRNDWFASQQIQQEARVALLREVMTALNASTSALGSFQKTVDERTKTADQLQGNFGEMTLALQGMRSAITDATEASRKIVLGIQDDIAALRREARKP